jgi:hypothetical protein
MLTAWVTANHAVVGVIGPHDQSENDVYALLLDALELDVPVAERDKPPCCDEEGAPPADESVSMNIGDAIDRFARARRRRR